MTDQENLGVGFFDFRDFDIKIGQKFPGMNKNKKKYVMRIHQITINFPKRLKTLDDNVKNVAPSFFTLFYQTFLNI